MFSDPRFVGGLSLTRHPYWSGLCWPAPETCLGISWWNFHHHRAVCAGWCRLPVAFASVKFEKYNGEIFTTCADAYQKKPSAFVKLVWEIHANTNVLLLARRNYLLVPLWKCICEVWKMQLWYFYHRGVLIARWNNLPMELSKSYMELHENPSI